VNFVQNLVHYIGRAYRTPDYGIWERGNKINNAHPELNASSVGMAKAALEAINKLDLFGIRGSQASVVHVLPDEIARARITLQNLLPRESNSKEVDAALLSAISFPAFAVEDAELVERTRSEIINKLQGRYGCKRFLRDGHQTVLENCDRLHYEPWELQQFEHIECEWPLFFTYLLLDSIFRGDAEQVKDYQERLESLLVERDGLRLLPELYYVPAENIEAEKANPHSQPRLPNENIPLVWAQGLYLLGQMLSEGLLSVGDIDPLGRYLGVDRQREAIVQIALLAENEELQAKLEVHGIETQTPKQLEPIQVRHAGELSVAYTQVGRNDKLGLSGRPARRLRSLTTSRIYRLRGETMVFLPAIFDPQQFYLALDHYFLVEAIKSELTYIRNHWNQLGRPTMTLMLTHTMLETGSDALLALMQELTDGHCNGVKVKLGRLKQLMLTAGTERIDFLHDFEFSQEAIVKDTTPRQYRLAGTGEKNSPLNYSQEFQIESETHSGVLLSQLRASENLYEQIQLLQRLTRLFGLEFDTGFGGSGQTVTVADLIDEVYTKAGQLGIWAIIRQAAGLRQMVDLCLSDMVTNLLVNGKQVTVGKSYSETSLMTSPIPNNQIMQKIKEFCREDIRDGVLTQEILIYLGLLIKSEPHLFDGLLTLRVGYLILLITTQLARELDVTQDEAYQQLMELAPFEVARRLYQVMAEYAKMAQLLRQQESLPVKQNESEIDWEVQSALQDEAELPQSDWLRYRQQLGSMNHVPKDFFKYVWRLMKCCKGVLIGDKLEPRNRLDTELLLAQMTPGEKNFALRVEHLLNKISVPEYRQVNVETLMVLAQVCDRNPNLQIEEYIVLDVLIGHAVRLAWLERYPGRTAFYDQDKAAAWCSFYNTSPSECASFCVKAFRFLTQIGQRSAV
ncbi:MAG: glycosyl hydrolase family 15, partial [Coleofasciculus sp. Co-bin14]|nr:glycosyl hydrolase family 15 [Coleofasciculus sp. Co-bin14]